MSVAGFEEIDSIRRLRRKARHFKRHERLFSDNFKRRSSEKRSDLVVLDKEEKKEKEKKRCDKKKKKCLNMSRFQQVTTYQSILDERMNKNYAKTFEKELRKLKECKKDDENVINTPSPSMEKSEESSPNYPVINKYQKIKKTEVAVKPSQDMNYTNILTSFSRMQREFSENIDNVSGQLERVQEMKKVIDNECGCGNDNIPEKEKSIKELNEGLDRVVKMKKITNELISNDYNMDIVDEKRKEVYATFMELPFKVFKKIVIKERIKLSEELRMIISEFEKIVELRNRNSRRDLMKRALNTIPEEMEERMIEKATQMTPTPSPKQSTPRRAGVEPLDLAGLQSEGMDNDTIEAEIVQSEVRKIENVNNEDEVTESTSTAPQESVKPDVSKRYEASFPSRIVGDEVTRSSCASRMSASSMLTIIETMKSLSDTESIKSNEEEKSKIEEPEDIQEVIEDVSPKVTEEPLEDTYNKEKALFEYDTPRIPTPPAQEKESEEVEFDIEQYCRSIYLYEIRGTMTDLAIQNSDRLKNANWFEALKVWRPPRFESFDIGYDDDMDVFDSFNIELWGAIVELLNNRYLKFENKLSKQSIDNFRKDVEEMTERQFGPSSIETDWHQDIITSKRVDDIICLDTDFRFEARRLSTETEKSRYRLTQAHMQGIYRRYNYKNTEKMISDLYEQEKENLIVQTIQTETGKCYQEAQGNGDN